jgi:hypothetical protein
VTSQRRPRPEAAKHTGMQERCAIWPVPAPNVTSHGADGNGLLLLLLRGSARPEVRDRHGSTNHQRVNGKPGLLLLQTIKYLEHNATVVSE